jgi:hypothetical protein
MQIIGLLIGFALVSVVGALLIRLAVKLVTRTSIGFSGPFWISFISLVVAYVVQQILGGVFAPLPALSMFLTTWLLCANVVGRGENGQRSYTKALAVTAIQFTGLMLIVAMIAVSFIALQR